MDTAQGSESRIPILAYHSIDSSGSVISTASEKFRSQMQYLADSSFRVVSLDEITTCIGEKRPFPRRAVAITFDDGFKNLYYEAYPVLKELGFKATVFLVTGYCGRNNRWKGQPGEVPTLDLLSWDEITEMAGGGIDFGAHTVNHPDLSRLPLKQATEEIADSRLMIEDCLGKNVLFFAYPYGRQSEQVKSFVRDKFSGACSTKLGFVTLKSDVHSLPRIDMYYFSQNNFFTWLENPIFSHYIKCRDILRSFKEINRITHFL